MMYPYDALRCPSMMTQCVYWKLEISNALFFSYLSPKKQIAARFLHFAPKIYSRHSFYFPMCVCPSVSAGQGPGTKHSKAQQTRFIIMIIIAEECDCLGPTLDDR